MLRKGLWLIMAWGLVSIIFVGNYLIYDTYCQKTNLISLDEVKIIKNPLPQIINPGEEYQHVVKITADKKDKLLLKIEYQMDEALYRWFDLKIIYNEIIIGEKMYDDMALEDYFSFEYDPDVEDLTFVFCLASDLSNDFQNEKISFDLKVMVVSDEGY